MEKLITHYRRFCWWLQRLVQRISPTDRFSCAIHGPAAVRTFGISGKACVYCLDEQPQESALYDLKIIEGKSHIQLTRPQGNQKLRTH
jgi:hypothetical protein